MISSAPSHRENPLFGIFMALLSASFFGLITTTAKISYDEGSNATTAALGRALFAVVTGFFVCIFLAREWRIPRIGWGATTRLSIGLAGMSVCYMAAVQFIPVSLAAILFYTHPICVLAAESCLNREVPDPVRIIAYSGAFTGLVLAIGPSFQGLDWRGLALVAIGVLSASIMFFAARTARQHTNEMALAMWANVLSVPIICGAMVFLGGIRIPGSTNGLAALLLVCLFFTGAFISYTTCLKHTTPARAAMFFNLEPLVSIVVALVILGEVLSFTQSMGAAMVLGALALSAWQTHRLSEAKPSAD